MIILKVVGEGGDLSQLSRMDVMNKRAVDTQSCVRRAHVQEAHCI